MHKRLWPAFRLRFDRKTKTCPELRREIENLKWLGLSVIASVLAMVGALAHAQQPAKIPQIGFLIHGAPSVYSDRTEAFNQGLRELGYFEGKNISIERRYAEGRSERLPELAEQLVRLQVDILVASSAAAARAAKKSTATIPIVVANAGDPVGGGLVASLARPGGNVTGLTNYSLELLGKRLELLKEVVPKVSRFAFLNDADARGSKLMFEDAQVAAKALGVRLHLAEVKAPDPDLEGAFRAMVKERIGALITSGRPLLLLHRKRILELVEQNRMPAMHDEREWVNAGGLMSYGANQVDLYRRAATYVDKILKGTKPADLPVEAPMKFDFVFNLKTAKQIGLTIPPNVLARADRVIK